MGKLGTLLNNKVGSPRVEDAPSIFSTALEWVSDLVKPAIIDAATRTATDYALSDASSTFEKVKQRIDTKGPGYRAILAFVDKLIGDAGLVGEKDITKIAGAISHIGGPDWMNQMALNLKEGSKNVPHLEYKFKDRPKGSTLTLLLAQGRNKTPLSVLAKQNSTWSMSRMIGSPSLPPIGDYMREDRLLANLATQIFNGLNYVGAEPEYVEEFMDAHVRVNRQLHPGKANTNKSTGLYLFQGIYQSAEDIRKYLLAFYASSLRDVGHMNGGDDIMTDFANKGSLIWAIHEGIERLEEGKHDGYLDQLVLMLNNPGNELVFNKIGQ